MSAAPFRPDYRPRHGRFRRRPNWVARGSPQFYEDGEIQSKSPLPPPSPPWRRQHRFPRPVKRFRRNDFPPPRPLSPPPPRSQPPILGPVPMLEIPLRRRSRFDITPDDAKNHGWPPPPLPRPDPCSDYRAEFNKLPPPPDRASSFTAPPPSRPASPKLPAPIMTDSSVVPVRPVHESSLRSDICSAASSPKASIMGDHTETGDVVMIREEAVRPAENVQPAVLDLPQSESAAPSPLAAVLLPLLPADALPNQGDLLQQIQRLDDEIAEIELKVSHQRQLIASANDTDNNVPSDEIEMVIADSERSHEVLTENRHLAALAAQALSKLNPAWINERLSDGAGAFYEPLYREPGQSVSYERTEQILAKNRPRLVRALRCRRLGDINDQCRLALQWWQYYRDWRKSEKALPPLRHSLTADQRAYYATRLATIPPMLSARERRAASWRSRNALVEDPRAQDQFRKLINPWSDQEKAVFRKKFAKFPKNFVRLASFLPNKSVGDCVAHYYASKNVVNYKALVKKYRQSLLSRKGIDVTLDVVPPPVDTPPPIPRELLQLADDLSRNNLEVQSGRRAGKKRRTDSDLSNISLDAVV